jgi:hypothetical protein
MAFSGGLGLASSVLARPWNMNLEDRIRQLSEEMINCRDEARIVLLSRELQTLLHEHMEQLRSKLVIASEPSRNKAA